MTTPPAPPRLSTARILGYSFGEGARVTAVNGLSNFGLLFYTHALGLSAGGASLALSLSFLLNAFSAPIVGQLTNNTRSRWGNRLPWIAVGGPLASASFCALWLVPRTGLSHHAIAIQVFAANLLFQLSMTLFNVPYTALGFDICAGYEERSRLQGIRTAFGMAGNLVFGGLAWIWFFRDTTGPGGVRIDGTTVTSNYTDMGVTLGLATLFLALLCIAATVWTATDNRQASLPGHGLRAFRDAVQSILGDRLAWQVLGFTFLVQIGVLVVMQSQIFTYVYFMRLSANAKAFIHISGIVAYAVAALFQSWLTCRTDKKFTAIVGLALAVAGGVFLQGIFFGLHVNPAASCVLLGTSIPLGTVLFGLGAMTWWAGIGIVSPLLFSMIADIAEIDFLRNGIQRDGSYAAVLSFVQKTGTSVGLLITGWMIGASGFTPGTALQTSLAAQNVAMLTFLGGPAFILASFFILRRYPVNRAFLSAIRSGSR